MFEMPPTTDYLKLFLGGVWSTGGGQTSRNSGSVGGHRRRARHRSTSIRTKSLRTSGFFLWRRRQPLAHFRQRLTHCNFANPNQLVSPFEVVIGEPCHIGFNDQI